MGCLQLYVHLFIFCSLFAIPIYGMQSIWWFHLAWSLKDFPLVYLCKLVCRLVSNCVMVGGL
jgi:hypothetical protein